MIPCGDHFGFVTGYDVNVAVRGSSFRTPVDSRVRSVSQTFPFESKKVSWIQRFLPFAAFGSGTLYSIQSALLRAASSSGIETSMRTVRTGLSGPKLRTRYFVISARCASLIMPSGKIGEASIPQKADLAVRPNIVSSIAFQPASLLGRVGIQFTPWHAIHVPSTRSRPGPGG